MHNNYDILALVSGLPSPIRQECPLVVLQAFVDDTNKGNEPVFALGGLVASVEQWLRFDDPWRKKLWEAPAIGYFKASEAAALEGQFKGWSVADRDRKVSGLVSLINEYPTAYLGCAIFRKDWNEVFRGKMAKTMDSPVFFAYMRIITALLNAMYHRADLFDVAEFIFDDESQTIYREVLNFWLESQKEYPRRFRKRMGNHPVMRDDKTIVALQAADLVAWTFGKVCSPEPHPSMAVDVADRLTLEGIQEIWTRAEIEAFSARTHARGAGSLEYETGKMRSARLKELLGPRRA